MIFHQIQLMACAALARHYARRSLQVPLMPICGKRLRPLVPFLVEVMGAARPSPTWAGGDSAPLTDARILGPYAIAGSAGCAVYAISELPISRA